MDKRSEELTNKALEILKKKKHEGKPSREKEINSLETLTGYATLVRKESARALSEFVGLTDSIIAGKTLSDPLIKESLSALGIQMDESTKKATQEKIQTLAQLSSLSDPKVLNAFNNMKDLTASLENLANTNTLKSQQQITDTIRASFKVIEAYDKIIKDLPESVQKTQASEFIKSLYALYDSLMTTQEFILEGFKEGDLMKPDEILKEFKTDADTKLSKLKKYTKIKNLSKASGASAVLSALIAVVAGISLLTSGIVSGLLLIIALFFGASTLIYGTASVLLSVYADNKKRDYEKAKEVIDQINRELFDISS